MGDVIDLKEQSEMARRGEPTDADFERFLVDEGLGILAAYRSISDETVRTSVRVLIETLAGSRSRSKSATE